MVHSGSPSVSSEESFLDAYENWDRIVSLLGRAQVWLLHAESDELLRKIMSRE